MSGVCISGLWGLWKHAVVFSTHQAAAPCQIKVIDFFMGKNQISGRAKVRIIMNCLIAFFPNVHPFKIAS